MSLHHKLGLLLGTSVLAIITTVIGCEIYTQVAQEQNPLSVVAQTSVQAKVVEILDGNEVYIQGKSAPLQSIATSGQTVSTGASRTQLQFSDQAIARLSKNSRLTLGRCTQLERGSILVSGAVSTCTTNITAAVRGTTYYLETNENDDDLKVLEGEVDVTDRRSASLRQVRVRAGQRFRFQRKMARQIFNQQSVGNLSSQDYDNILQGDLSRSFRNDLPTLNKVRKTHQQLFPKTPFPNYRRAVTGGIPNSLPFRLPKLQ